MLSVASTRYPSCLVLYCALVFPLALLTGCVERSSLAENYQGPAPLPAETFERFLYPEMPIHNSSTVHRETDAYTIKHVVFPLGIEENESPIRLEYYKPAGEGRKPVILVLPVLNAGNFFARNFAHYFAMKGFAAVIVKREKGNGAGILDQPEEAMRQLVLRHRRALDWVSQNDDFDHSRIGVFGVSAGGINTVLLAAVDDRVAAAMPVLAGGDLPYIVTHTKERSLERSVSKLLQARNLSRDELLAYLREHISTDPLHLAPHVDARRVLMVLARSDKVVPFSKQEELRKALGEPEAIYLPTGHVSSVIFMPYLKAEGYRFFKERFQL